jgi:hypothetical protein
MALLPGVGQESGDVLMAPAAAYDEIADWYEQEFLPSSAAAGADPLGIGAPRRSAAAPVSMRAGCGTGVHASRLRPPAALTEADHNTGANVSEPDTRAAETGPSGRRAKP